MAVKEANSLLFCILTTACLKTNVLKCRKDFSCFTFILLLWQRFSDPTPTFSINSQMIALLKYSIAVHSIPCKANANLFYTVTCVNTRRPHGYIAKRVMSGTHKGMAREPDPSRHTRLAELEERQLQAQVDDLSFIRDKED